MAGDTPVIAAGSITTGRHLAGAITLGAAGVWTGTVWLASRESDVDMIIKEKILAASQEDTSFSACISGFTMRTLKCKWHEELGWAQNTEAGTAAVPAAPFRGRQAVGDRLEHRIVHDRGRGTGRGLGDHDEAGPVDRVRHGGRGARGVRGSLRRAAR